MNKGMLDLYKKLDLQERGEKREKDELKSYCIVFPFSIFFPFYRVSFTSMFFFTYDLTRSYFTVILEYLCLGKVACNGQLYFQLV